MTTFEIVADVIAIGACVLGLFLWFKNCDLRYENEKLKHATRGQFKKKA